MPQASPDLPPRPEFIAFTVPLLCEPNQYDRVDFWTYPNRCGWIIDAKDTRCHVLCPPGVCYHGMSAGEIRDAQGEASETAAPVFQHSDGKPVRATDKVRLLQAWLFFGALLEVSKLCGLELDVEADYIIDNTSVSTARLNGLPRRWFEAAVIKGCAGQTAAMERILNIARYSSLMLLEEFADGKPKFTYTLSECHILHSLTVVVRIIGLHLLLHTYMPGFVATEEEGWSQARVERCLGRSLEYNEGRNQLAKAAEKQLEDQGWCPSELELLATDDLAFAVHLDRPRIRDHSHCRDLICGAYQTDEGTYRTRHTAKDCMCDPVRVETSDLVASLSEGKIPKFVVTKDLELQLVCDHHYQYIALSHVWADGLGNPLENALPRCQLKRLRGYVNHLSSILGHTSSSPATPIAFWMDTLCIPVSPTAQTYRKKAIQLLGKTFQHALAVLILDRELEIVPSTTTSFLELAFRILCSGWVKRLWTLQEATLASESGASDRLYFQMSDGPFLYQKYDRDRKTSHSKTAEVRTEERYLLLDYGVMMLLGEQIPSIQAIRHTREGFSSFDAVYTAVEHRSTSKAEDIPVCIATLLGRDASTILAARGAEERMAALYVLMHKIPMFVLWAERANKLTLAPFRWVPKTITECKRTVYMDRREGICDAAGLHIRIRGFVFTVDDNFMEQNLDPLMLPRCFGITRKRSGIRYNGPILQYCLTKRTGQILLQQHQRLALISKPIDGHGNGDPKILVVVIEHTQKDDEIHSTELFCRVVGYASYRGEGKVEDSELEVQGEATSLDQQWCVT